jgi:hypothetical protein
LRGVAPERDELLRGLCKVPPAAAAAVCARCRWPRRVWSCATTANIGAAVQENDTSMSILVDKVFARSRFVIADALEHRRYGAPQTR